MPLPWMKMWVEALDDSKLTMRSLAERGAWWGIVQLAHKCGAGGKIVSGGEGLNIEEIADALHIKTPEDRKSLESMIAHMEKKGSLVWNDKHILTVIHYEERQSIPPSARPEAVAERVRRHRERQKGAHAPIDTDVLREISLRVRKKRKELGRELTPQELQDIKDAVNEKFESER